MSNILSRVAASRRRIVPQSVDDFVGLQVCRALRDESHAYDYLLLARRSNARMLLSAFHSIQDAVATGWPVHDSFVAGLNATTGREASLHSDRLIALSIERHKLGLAVFRGLRLEHKHVRHLHTNLTKAQLGAAAFVRWALAQFGDGGVVIETEPKSDTARAQIYRSIVAAVRESATSLWQINSAELIGAYSHPEPATRGEFRKIVAGIWRSLTFEVSDRVLLDGIGLGLLASVKRQLDGEELQRGEG